MSKILSLLLLQLVMDVKLTLSSILTQPTGYKAHLAQLCLPSLVPCSFFEPTSQIAGDLPTTVAAWVANTQASHVSSCGKQSLATDRSKAVWTGVTWWVPGCHHSASRLRAEVLEAVSSPCSHISAQEINRKAKPRVSSRRHASNTLKHWKLRLSVEVQTAGCCCSSGADLSTTLQLLSLSWLYSKGSPSVLWDLPFQQSLQTYVACDNEFREKKKKKNTKGFLCWLQKHRHFEESAPRHINLKDSRLNSSV